VHFGHDATEEYVEQIYRYAYQLGCKGVTYIATARREPGAVDRLDREESAGRGRKDALVEALGRIAELDTELHLDEGAAARRRAENLQRRAKRSRPDLLKARRAASSSPLGTMYVTITEDDKGQPFEVFMSLGKGGGALIGGCRGGWAVISSRAVGVPLLEIYRQLRGISSDRAWARSEQGDVRPRRDRHRHREVDAEKQASSRICWRAPARQPGAGGSRAGARATLLCVRRVDLSRISSARARLRLAVGVYRGMC